MPAHPVLYLKHLVSIITLAAVFYLLLNLPAFLIRVQKPNGPVGFLPTVTQPEATKQGLTVARLGISAPINFDQDASDEPRLLQSLQSGVTHLLGTARPGEKGNTVIVGHSSNYPWDRGQYKTVFASLGRLEALDFIELRRGKTTYLYQVTGKRVVAPTDLFVLAQTSEPQLTLITCTPLGTTWRRLVVTARQISPDPAANRAFAGQPLVGSLPGPR